MALLEHARQQTGVYVYIRNSKSDVWGVVATGVLYVGLYGCCALHWQQGLGVWAGAAGFTAMALLEHSRQQAGVFECNFFALGYFGIWVWGVFHPVCCV
jgi:hypothetical protein